MTVKDEVLITVQQIETLLERRSNLVKLIAQQNEDLETFEVQTAGEVASDPLFTNDTKRKAEIQKRLAECDKYIQHKDIHTSTKNELMELENELEGKRYKMKGYDIITRPLWQEDKMREYRLKITHKDLIELLRNGKTNSKFDFQVEEVECDPETKEYVVTRFLDTVDFIEVEQ